MYRTEQDRIDAETLRLDNPERVLGSGFIQFPPQVAFQRPVTQQPPTMTEYDSHTGSSYRRSGVSDRYQGRPRQGGRGGYQGAKQNGAESSGRARGPQGSAQRGSSGYQGAQAQHPIGFQKEAEPSWQPRYGGDQSDSQQMSQHRSHRRGEERRQPVVANGTAQSADSQTYGHQNVSQPAGIPNHSNSSRLIVNAAPGTGRPSAIDKASEKLNNMTLSQSNEGNKETKANLSKSQAKRLRKKMREGKVEA